MTSVDDLIKVHVAGENLWAFDLGNNTAKLDNLPFTEGLHIGDTVQLDAENNILGVLDREFEFKSVVEYHPPTKEVGTKLLRELNTSKQQCKAEGWFPGTLCVCYNETPKALLDMGDSLTISRHTSKWLQTVLEKTIGDDLDT